MRIKIVKQAAWKMLTNWDYSKLDSVRKYDLTFDIKALIVKMVVFSVHVLCVVTLPLSVFAVIKVGRMAEISSLKSWVKTMRRDRRFFREHHYIEIKQYIKEHEKAYHLTLHW